MLKKQYRLKKRKEFGFIYKNGKYSACKILSVTYCKGYKKPCKVGFSVSNKIGNAVVRNKIKRRLRDCTSKIIGKLNDNYNYVIVAREPISETSYKDINESLIYCLNKAGLLKNNEE